MTLVLDASVALDWCFESERTPYAVAVLDHVIAHGALLPPLAPAEIANGLLSASRRRKISPAGIAESLSLLASLSIDLADQEVMPALQALLDTAQRFGLTGYDAAYLSLAMQRALPVATNDGALRQAAYRAGVPVFGLEATTLQA